MRGFRKKRNTAKGRRFIIEVERMARGGTQPEIRGFEYVAEGDGDTVATALQAINARPDLRDTEGRPAHPIEWECSCLQKRCGGCAMRINGQPSLACDAALAGLPERVRLEPLRKFPRVADLLVDRSVMRDNLAAVTAYLRKEASFSERTAEDAYAASKCLQCGLCLEVCPNFEAGGVFGGAAAGMPVSRILTAGAGDRDLENAYAKRVFEGCGKSLACEKICPAGIPVGEMLAQSNAAAVWRIRARRS